MLFSKKTLSQFHNGWNQKTQDEMKKLGKEITDLKQSLEFTENVQEEKVKKLDEKHVNLENQCNEVYNNSIESEYF